MKDSGEQGERRAPLVVSQTPNFSPCLIAEIKDKSRGSKITGQGVDF